jgi:hypothetical protein
VVAVDEAAVLVAPEPGVDGPFDGHWHQLRAHRDRTILIGAEKLVVGQQDGLRIGVLCAHAADPHRLVAVQAAVLVA